MIDVHLMHRFEGFDIDVSLHLPVGVTALFGHSGAGKTTVVNAIAGLLRPDQARIVVNGRVVADTDAKLWIPPNKRRVGYVFQDARLFDHMSVRRNLLYGAPVEGRLPEIVDLLGIAPLLDRRPRDLSGGERQRVAIGRALLSEPDLLLMDEPLAALDAPRKAEILPYLIGLRDEARLPILYVSHAMSEVAQLANTLVLMEAGRVVAAGPVDEVLADPDLVPHLGIRNAGSVLTGVLEGDPVDGLSRLRVPGGDLLLPELSYAQGRHVRVRIEAQDVILSLTRPQGISALNVLEGRVGDIKSGSGPGAIVSIDLGASGLLARVTRRSVTAMSLQKGQPIFAIIKTVAVAPVDIGAVGNAIA